jgi:NhaP-type Na+/H+ or K+/H+ antiporter
MGAIAMLAFVGTGVSAACVAVMMWLLGVMHLSFRIHFYHACLFGAIISATDPVTVLAVFGRLQADVNLNALVFGESVLNDAVAIVLYNVIYKFGQDTGPDVSFSGILHACWEFFYIFAGSLVIGVAFALIAALVFRTGYFKDEHAPMEAAIVLIIAYSSFYLADGLECAFAPMTP